MSLSPEEIVDFPLKHAVRGYKVEQVDELLDKVADRIEQLERELDSTRGTLSAVESRLDESTETEATLKRTLITAQRAAEDTVAEAHARASAIVSDAEQRAEELVSGAERQADELRAATMRDLRVAEADSERRRDEAERRIAALHRLADQFERSLREHLERHRELLDDVPVLDGLPRDDEPAVPDDEPAVVDDVRDDPVDSGHELTQDTALFAGPDAPWAPAGEAQHEQTHEDFRA